MGTLKCITLGILIYFDAYFWIVPDVLGGFIIQATYDLSRLNLPSSYTEIFANTLCIIFYV